MKTAKLILITLGIIFAAILAFLLFGLAVQVLQYLFFFAVILLVGVAAVKVLKRPEREPPQLGSFKDEDKALAHAERVLAEYKRKHLPK